MKKFRWAARALLSLGAAALLAPVALLAEPVRHTAPYVPTTAIGFGDKGETWSPVTADTPLPVAVISGGGGGGGAGTEYTEDAAAAANPVGGMLICRRKDTLSTSEVSADGDNIAVNCSNKGEVRVMDTDLLAAIGSPFQAGASIANTQFGATQVGTWNITDISGTVSLPTGAATAAKQPALGTAGSPSADVITVQGSSSGTALPVRIDPSAASSAGVRPTSDAAVATLSAKTSSGNIYGINLVNSTTAGYLVLYDAASMPSAAASLTDTDVLYCLPVAASTGISDHFSTPMLATSGVMAMFSTSCSARNDVSPAPLHLAVQVK